jgi:HSP20 family protein
MSWDPVRDLRAWHNRLERLAGHAADAWAPAIDVYETSGAYIVTAELPGLRRDQIELVLEDSRLTIRGQRPARPAEAEIVHFHQVERGHGAFARSFEFAEHVDSDRVTADLANGVLTITLLKAPPPPPRKIDVK